MMRSSLILLLAAGALALSPAPPAEAAAPAASAVAGGCGVAPALALLPSFEDPRRLFAPDSRSFRAVARNFAAAYLKACRAGTLRGPLIGAGVVDGDRLFLMNAPYANVASIYEMGDGPARGPMVLEFPFIGEDGKVNIPSVASLQLAITCSYQAAASDEPPGDSLECLPD